MGSCMWSFVFTYDDVDMAIVTVNELYMRVYIYKIKYNIYFIFLFTYVVHNYQMMS